MERTKAVTAPGPVFSKPKTSKPLVQISPPPDEFLTEVQEQLIISIQTSLLLDEYLTEEGSS